MACSTSSRDLAVDPGRFPAFRLVAALAMIALMNLLPVGTGMRAQAQTETPPPAAPATTPSSEDQAFNAQQLDQLVAPIALYPDPLLAEVLAASTYPLEIVQADRWVTANKNLKGDALKAAAEKQDWDDSVKSLIATPDVLSMMSTQLEWTQKLGDAVLAQQSDVMEAVQRLRAKAQAQNKLQTTAQQTVSVQQDQGSQVITIVPAQPDTIYVPWYDPAVVYGTWGYPAYPPYYFGAPGYIAGAAIATGIAFGAGYAIGRWAGGAYWRGGVNWHGHTINNFQHNSYHRRGVAYGNAGVQQRYGGNNGVRGGAQGRTDFRGRDNAGNRGGVQGGNAGNRGGAQGGNAGNRAGVQGGNAGNRGGGANAGGRAQGAANAAGRGPGAGNAGGRPAGGSNALGNVQSRGAANAQSQRGRSSVGGGGGGGARAGGGGARAGGGGGGGRGGGGGGGRRSDIRLKHDIVLLGEIGQGVGFYRFAYNGSHKAYVGVMAQEVQSVKPEAVERGGDGYLRVHYEKLGLTFETYDRWVEDGAQIPTLQTRD